MKKTKTRLTIVCAWHKKNFGTDLVMGTKDGKGATGITSGICKACAKIEWGKLPPRPARWNLVGRFLARRRQKREAEANARRIAEQRAALAARADKEVDDRRALEDMFATNPGLHARVMLEGRRLVHYITPEDLATLQAKVKDEPEIKCRWN